jgi:hypothetical protein
MDMLSKKIFDTPRLRPPGRRAILYLTNFH